MEKTVFSNEQFQHIYPDGIENHYWNHARNHIILGFIKRNALQGEKILEIGGGRGVVTRFLHEKGIACTGVEQAPVAPVEGVKDYFFTGTDAFDLEEKLRKEYRVILLLDVIEHIEFPGEFISKIIQYFPNASHLLITVPARKELWTNYDEFNGHYRRYSLDDLKLPELKAVFIRGGYFNHILYPVFGLFARIVRQRNVELKAPAGWQIPVHRFLSFLLQLDYRIVPVKWKGTSCIALFEIKIS